MWFNDFSAPYTWNARFLRFVDTDRRVHYCIRYTKPLPHSGNTPTVVVQFAVNAVDHSVLLVNRESEMLCAPWTAGIPNIADGNGHCRRAATRRVRSVWLVDR